MMFGGLKWTASRLAFFAAAGLLVGGLNTGVARAADLGGDCCADLEERVAALEATTARKGNRVVSLTVSGHVTRGLLYWSDNRSDAYVVDNWNTASRFRFLGSAKVNADISVGYFIEIGIHDTRSIDVNQLGPSNANDGQGSSNVLRMRQTNWWLESKTFGRLTVGQITGAADGTDVVDLGDLGVVTSAETYLTPASLLMFNKSTGLYCGQTGSNCHTGLNWNNGTTGAVDPARHDGIKYETPTWNGFQFATSWGENDSMAAALKFANEWNGLRVAAAVGYIWDRDEQAVSGFTAFLAGQLGANGGVGGVLGNPNQPFNNVTGGDHDARRWQLSGSIWHVPSGVFVSGSWTNHEFKGSLDRDVNGQQRPDMTYLWLAAGLRKNWFGIGTTAIYAEYGKGDDVLTGTFFDTNTAAAVQRIASNDNWLWGVGIVQNVDAIATEFFAGYRHHEVNISTEQCAAPVGAVSVCGGPLTKQNLESLDTLFVGAKIRF